MNNKTIVNKEKGIVVKTLLDENGTALFERDYRKFMPKWMHFIMTDIIILGAFPNSPDIIKGIARLSEDDEWDEEVGRRCAESKLAKKIHERVLKQAMQSKYLLEDIIKCLDKMIDYHEKKIVAIQKDYNRYFMGKGR